MKSNKTEKEELKKNTTTLTHTHKLNERRDQLVQTHRVAHAYTHASTLKVKYKTHCISCKSSSRFSWETISKFRRVPFS